ncbi:MAG: TRAP transporter small permease subunit [Rhodospirillaceae bacterium]|nr:TRAP transporter small permease subunit [Rhodospirillaceae bacterium]
MATTVAAAGWDVMTFFNRLYDAVIRGLSALAGGILAAMILVIVVDVAARNLGFVPPAATVALTEYALLYFTMAAAPGLTRAKGHVTVRVILDRLVPASRAVAGRMIAVICASICLVLACLAAVLLAESVLLADVEPRSIDLPRWLLFLPLVVGFFFSGTEFLRFIAIGEDALGQADTVERI